MIGNSRALGVAVAMSLVAGCSLFDRTGDPGTSPSENREVDAVSVRFHLATGEDTPDYTPREDEAGQPLFVAPRAFLTDADVWHAEVLTGERGNLVLLELTEMGKSSLEWLTQRHVGGRLAVFINGELVMSPWIRAPLTGGRVYLNGEFSKRRAERIAEALNMQRAARSPILSGHSR